LVLAIELQNRVSLATQLSNQFDFGHWLVLAGGFADVVMGPTGQPPPQRSLSVSFPLPAPHCVFIVKLNKEIIEICYYFTKMSIQTGILALLS